MKSVVAAVSKLPPIMARFVPFAAVAGANCVNLPFMRWNEIRDGIAVFDQNGKRVGGKSKHNPRTNKLIYMFSLYN